MCSARDESGSPPRDSQFQRFTTSVYQRSINTILTILTVLTILAILTILTINTINTVNTVNTINTVNKYLNIRELHRDTGVNRRLLLILTSRL